VWREVTKGVKDGCRNGLKDVSGVARPQGEEGSGMAGPGETLKSPWIPLVIQAYGPVRVAQM
jgi:hypothetical protein